MKLLTNPIILASALVFLLAIFAFLMLVAIARRLRRRASAETFMSNEAPSLAQLPLHTYNSVIQELKQQKHELLALQQSERRRAKTSENVSAAVLANLSSGVVFLTTNGLVRRTNAAARTILGYASPNGMNASELFRDARVISSSSNFDLARVVQTGVREQTPSQTVTARYTTPSGDERILDVTITCVRTMSGEVLGAACLITDQTAVALLKRQEDLRGEMSSEMALALRNSLNSIAGYARQIASGSSPDMVHQLAADIVSETAELDHSIGGFLASAKASAKGAGA
jgi:PAS domain-containing protein